MQNKINLTLYSEANQNKCYKDKNMSDYRAAGGSSWSYVAARNVDSGRRSEHKEIKMIITREADVVFDVMMG